MYCRAELKASQFFGKGFDDVIECADIQLTWGTGWREGLKIVLVYRQTEAIQC